MKVVLVPDSFKESMSAAAAAAAMARGVHQVWPTATCVEVPMADGGEGTVDALVAALGGDLHSVLARDARGRRVQAKYGRAAGGLAIIEVAAAVGLGLIAPTDRDIMRSTSLGVADLVQGALDSGATRLLIGLGGTATNDGGAGLLVGLGAQVYDATGAVVEPRPERLSDIVRLDLSGLDPRLADVVIDLACDVTNPLLGPTGASAIFGPQKGASPAQVDLLDAHLSHWADVLAAATGRDVRTWSGAGAAGGLGAAFLALGARLRPGVEVVAEAAGLDAAMADADLVLTGEGSIDAQTLSGKTPAGVAAVAGRHSVPVVALAGRLGPGYEVLLEHGFAAVVPIVRQAGPLPELLAAGPANLEAAAAMVVRLLQLGGELR